MGAQQWAFEPFVYITSAAAKARISDVNAYNEAWDETVELMSVDRYESVTRTMEDQFQCHWVSARLVGHTVFHLEPARPPRSLPVELAHRCDVPIP